METRKVQVTGGSTFTISIPKGWAARNDISAGSIVAFVKQGDVLVLTTRDRQREMSTEREFELPTKDGIRRGVLAMYLNGFDDVTFEVSGLDSTHRRIVTETTHQLIGLKVVAESRSDIRVRYLLDQSELSVPDTVGQMRQLALQMLSGAVDSLLAGDSERAEAVLDRDDELDRRWYLVSRSFRRALHDATAPNEMTVDRESCFDYRSTARQLERIGDHAVKIAETQPELAGAVPERIGADIDSLRADLVTLVASAVDTLEDDPENARERGNRLRDRVDECQRTVQEIERELWRHDPAHAQELRLVLDSLSRVADYGGNVADIVLQRATPTML